MIKLEDVTRKNIKSFIQGNFNFYASKVIKYPKHLTEQYRYRLYTCRDTCLKTGICESCGCPTEKKAFAAEACSTKFPDFLPGLEWQEYKDKNNIDIDLINKTIEEIENEIQ